METNGMTIDDIYAARANFWDGAHYFELTASDSGVRGDMWSDFQGGPRKVVVNACPKCRALIPWDDCDAHADDHLGIA